MTRALQNQYKDNTLNKQVWKNFEESRLKLLKILERRELCYIKPWDAVRPGGGGFI